MDLTAIAHADAQVEELGPLVAPGRARRLTPFFALVALAVVSMTYGSPIARPVLLGVGLAAAALTALVLLMPWRRLPRQAQGLIVLTWPGLVDAGLRADGGVGSHLLALMLVPLLWIALFEACRWLVVGIAVTGGVLFVDAMQRSASTDDRLRVIVVLVMAVAILPVLRRTVAVNRAALRAVSDMARRDALTGLVNRRGLEHEVVQRRVSGSGGQGFGFVFVDIDHFKEVNDRYGHGAGDLLLVEVGRRLSSMVRADDVVSRVGGDEFVIACHGDRTAVAGLAERVREAIRGAPVILGPEPILVSASVGFSHVSEQPDDVEELMRQADTAMYDVKKARAVAVVPKQRERTERTRRLDV